MSEYYVQDNVEKWVDKYTPDDWGYNKDNGSELIRGCWMRIGELLVSIQWSEYNYCDHYVGKSYHTVNLSPIHNNKYDKTREAEVAVICLTRFDFHYEYTYGMRHFVRFGDGDNIKPYASVPVIDTILKDCTRYAQA